MTPTTTEQAKVNPWWVDELTLHWGHGHSSHDTRRAAKTAIDQVEALIKERDEYRLLGDAMVAGHKAERDFLAIANKDLSEAMVRYQQLQDSAKLALDALDEATSYTSCSTWSPSMTRDCQSAITALRQAGVQ